MVLMSLAALLFGQLRAFMCLGTENFECYSMVAVLGAGGTLDSRFVRPSCKLCELQSPMQVQQPRIAVRPIGQTFAACRTMCFEWITWSLQALSPSTISRE